MNTDRLDHSRQGRRQELVAQLQVHPLVLGGYLNCVAHPHHQLPLPLQLLPVVVQPLQPQLLRVQLRVGVDLQHLAPRDLLGRLGNGLADADGLGRDRADDRGGGEDLHLPGQVGIASQLDPPPLSVLPFLLLHIPGFGIVAAGLAWNVGLRLLTTQRGRRVELRVGSRDWFPVHERQVVLASFKGQHCRALGLLLGFVLEKVSSVNFTPVERALSYPGSPLLSHPLVLRIFNLHEINVLLLWIWVLFLVVLNYVDFVLLLQNLLFELQFGLVRLPGYLLLFLLLTAGRNHLQILRIDGLSLIVEIDFVKFGVGLDQQPQVLIGHQIVGPFLADGTAPVLGGELAGAVAVDEAVEVEGVVVRVAVHRPHRSGNLAPEELAAEGHLDAPYHRLLVAGAQSLLEFDFRLADAHLLPAQLGQDLPEAQLPHCKHDYEVVGGRHVPEPLDAEVSLLDDDGVVLAEEAPVQLDGLVEALLDAGVVGEGLELGHLAAVAVDHAVDRPAELVLVLGGQLDAPSLDAPVLPDRGLERQIDFIFDFILADLAQIPSKQHCLHAAVGDAVPQEAHRALVELLRGLPPPEAARVTQPSAPVASFQFVADRRVALEAEAVVVLVEARVVGVVDVVLVVAGVVLVGREVFIDVLLDVAQRLVHHPQVAVLEEPHKQLHPVLGGAVAGLELLELTHQPVDYPVLELALGLPQLLALEAVGEVVDELLGATLVVVELAEPVLETAPEVFAHEYSSQKSLFICWGIGSSNIQAGACLPTTTRQRQTQCKWHYNQVKNMDILADLNSPDTIAQFKQYEELLLSKQMDRLTVTRKHPPKKKKKPEVPAEKPSILKLPSYFPKQEVPQNKHYKATKEKVLWDARFNCNKADLFQKKLIEQRATYERQQSQIKAMYGPFPNLVNLHHANNEHWLKDLRSGFKDTNRFEIPSFSPTSPSLITLNRQDVDTLRPLGDLKGSIINWYIKLIHNVFLPAHMRESTFFFSDFLMTQLIGQKLDQMTNEDDMESAIKTCVGSVKAKYKNVERWTKKEDIFKKDILVIPVNAFGHWFMYFVLNPRALVEANGGRAKMVYCDSMFEAREFITAAVRTYIEEELFHKKRLTVRIGEHNMPCHSLVLPRQTNSHDCGLYMLTYIEELLLRKEKELAYVETDYTKIDLVPRPLVFSMRHRLTRLLVRLAFTEADPKQLVEDFIEEKNRLKEKYKDEVDTVDKLELSKWKAMYPERKFQSEREELVHFYLVDPDINYHEPDRGSR